MSTKQYREKLPMCTECVNKPKPNKNMTTITLIIK